MKGSPKRDDVFISFPAPLRDRASTLGRMLDARGLRWFFYDPSYEIPKSAVEDKFGNVLVIDEAPMDISHLERHLRRARCLVVLLNEADLEPHSELIPLTEGCAAELTYAVALSRFRWFSPRIYSLAAPGFLPEERRPVLEELPRPRRHINPLSFATLIFFVVAWEGAITLLFGLSRVGFGAWLASLALTVAVALGYRTGLTMLRLALGEGATPITRWMMAHAPLSIALYETLVGLDELWRRVKEWFVYLTVWVLAPVTLLLDMGIAYSAEAVDPPALLVLLACHASAVASIILGRARGMSGYVVLDLDQ